MIKELVVIIALLCNINGLLSLSTNSISNVYKPRIITKTSSIVLFSTSTSTSTSTSSILSSSALIAGTTIGGGFLALPYVTFPIGFVPSLVGLIVSWAYLLASALSLSNATINVMNKQNNDNDNDNISVFKVATETYGNAAGSIAALLFIILMLSTLIAQLSKVGILLPNLLNHSLNKEMAILLFALFMSFVTFIKGIGVAEKINNILTLIMMISFSSIVAAALDPSAGFDINRLFNRSNFNSLLPFNAQSSMSWAIPYFLQLLVYTETIPLVVSRLNYKKDDITKSILLGSLIPLLMCIIWTAVSIGLIPYDYVSSSLTIDPVDFLLKSSTSKSIKNSILILTLSAISTTVIGSCLTISQFLNDILKGNKGLSRILSILPASLISAFGSKSLYYAATHFAGAFPVTLLWGLFPPLAFLKSSSSSSSSSSISNVKKLGQYVLILLSLLMLVINVINIS